MQIMNVNELGSDAVVRTTLLRIAASVSVLDAIEARSTTVISALERMIYRHVIINCADRMLGMDIAHAILKRFPQQSVVLISSKHSGGPIFPTLTVIPNVHHLRAVFDS